MSHIPRETGDRIPGWVVRFLHANPDLQSHRHGRAVVMTPQAYERLAMLAQSRIGADELPPLSTATDDG